MAFQPSAALLLLLLAIFWLPWILICVAGLTWWVAKGQRRRAGRYGLLAIVLLMAIPISYVGERIGFYTRLAASWPAYASDIRAIPGPIASKLRLWTWGGYLIFDDIFLTYDGSDSLKLPQNRESSEFKERLSNSIPNTNWNATHLVGHFYVLDVHG